MTGLAEPGFHYTRGYVVAVSLKFSPLLTPLSSSGQVSNFYKTRQKTNPRSAQPYIVLLIACSHIMVSPSSSGVNLAPSLASILPPFTSFSFGRFISTTSTLFSKPPTCPQFRARSPRRAPASKRLLRTLRLSCFLFT